MDMDPEFRKAGGPAFPFQLEMGENGTAYHPGMSLRDYFAAQIMAGTMANSVSLEDIRKVANSQNVTLGEQLAARAYYLADAMLAARTPSLTTDRNAA